MGEENNYVACGSAPETPSNVDMEETNPAEALSECRRAPEKRKERIIEGNLVLEADAVFDEDVVVRGGVFCKDGARYDLKVNGKLAVSMNCDVGVLAVKDDFSARDVNAWRIECQGAMEVDGITVKDGMTALDVHAGYVTAARDVNVRLLDSFDVTVDGNLRAWELKSKGNISAHNIETWSAEACNISAWGDMRFSGNAFAKGVVYAKGAIRCEGDFQADFVICGKFEQREGRKFSAYRVVGTLMNRSEARGAEKARV